MSSPNTFGLQHAIAALCPDDPWQATVAEQARLLTTLLTPWTAAAARLRRHSVPLAPRHAAQLAALAAQTRQQLAEAAALPQQIERDLALLRGMGTPVFPMPPAAAARLTAMEHAVDVLHANLVTARCPGYVRLRPATAVAFTSEGDAQQGGVSQSQELPVRPAEVRATTGGLRDAAVNVARGRATGRRAPSAGVKVPQASGHPDTHRVHIDHTSSLGAIAGRRTGGRAAAWHGQRR